VEIAEDGRHLSKQRGFLEVSERGRELGRVPLDDIDAVVATGHGLTLSKNLVVALAERGVPVVFCAANHMPAAFLWPADSHYEQAGRIADQAAAGKALKKRLWAQLVAAKVENQGAVLDTLGIEGGGFQLLARSVRVGDPTNVEAQAARRYWPLLFGTDFRRDRSEPGINAMLNYTYAVLRAGTARAIMAAGLHPSLGLAHRQRGNAFALVDDLMEPYRPLADLLVHGLIQSGVVAVDRDSKPALAQLLILDVASAKGVSPIRQCLERTAYSLSACFASTAKQLELPRRPLPLEVPS